MNYKALVLAGLISISFSISSCYSSKTFLKNDQIPEDFGKGNTTLLVVERGQRNLDRAIKNNFEKYYKGNYEIISADDFLTKTYSYNKYKYSFNTFSDYTKGGFSGGSYNGSSTDYYWGITNRSTSKSYKMLRMGGFKKLSKAYIESLEIVRKRNQ